MASVGAGSAKGRTGKNTQMQGRSGAKAPITTGPTAKGANMKNRRGK